MKKLTILLALCLCLNGTLALADDMQGEIPASPEGGEAVAEEVNEAAEITAAEAGEAADEGTPTGDETVENASGDQDAPKEENGAPAGENPDDPEGAGEQTPGEGDAAPAGEAGQSADGGQNGEAGNPNDQQPAENAPADEKNEAADPSEAEEGGDASQTGEPADPSQAGEGGEAAPETAEVPEDAEAWFERDGAKIGGRLEEILPQLTGNDTLNIVSKNVQKVVWVRDVALKPLADVILKLDPEDRTKAICISRVDPAGSETPETIELKALAECGDDEKGDLYFWIEPVKPEEPEPTPTEAPAPVLAVAAESYVAETWSAETPSFTLSGIPEGGQYSYAAVMYGERIVPLSGDTYVPDAEGQYSVRFVLLDGIGDIVSASETYQLWLDATAPEKVMVEADEVQSYALHITATDSLSGVTGVSLDGGATWTELTNGEIYTYVGEGPATLSPGAIQVRDAAGNLWRNEKEVLLEAVTPEPSYGGGGGGGGGSGDGKAAPSHASGDGEEGAEYETLALELPEEPMKQLTVGGEAMALTLVLDDAQAQDAPVGEDMPFTARLGSWCPAPKGEDAHENVLADPSEPAQDTLILTAEPEADLGDAFSFTWRFNGEVYRMLANSGIKYVALRIGDDLAAFPTEGFTGGTKYTELKMLGVSTRKFDYTLTMKVNLDPGYVSAMSDSDFSRDCDLSIRAEVENMAYELSSSTNSIMYFYDVYLGPEDMMAQPFGQYRAE